MRIPLEVVAPHGEQAAHANGWYEYDPVDTIKKGRGIRITNITSMTLRYHNYHGASAQLASVQLFNHNSQVGLAGCQLLATEIYPNRGFDHKLLFFLVICQNNLSNFSSVTDLRPKKLIPDTRKQLVTRDFDLRKRCSVRVTLKIYLMAPLHQCRLWTRQLFFIVTSIVYGHRIII